MAKKKRGDAHGGGHGWFVTFADLMGLMMSFFVMLVAFSTMDNNKLKIIAHRARDDLELVVVHRGKRDEHHKEAHHQAHQVGEGHEPAVPSSMRVATFLLGHA